MRTDAVVPAAAEKAQAPARGCWPEARAPLCALGEGRMPTSRAPTTRAPEPDRITRVSCPQRPTLVTSTLVASGAPGTAHLPPYSFHLPPYSFHVGIWPQQPFLVT